MVEILSVYVERKESEVAPKPEEVLIPGTCQPKCSHPQVCTKLGHHTTDCLMKGMPITPPWKARPAQPPTPESRNIRQKGSTAMPGTPLPPNWGTPAPSTPLAGYPAPLSPGAQSKAAGGPAPVTPPNQIGVGGVVPPGVHPDCWTHLNQVERDVLIRQAEGKLAGPRTPPQLPPPTAPTAEVTLAGVTQFIDHLPDHIQEGLMQELVNRGHARLEDEPMETPDQPRRYCRQQ